jgi:PilZ domain-containing protein/regulatory Fis family protein
LYGTDGQLVTVPSTGEHMVVNEKAWKDRCVPRIPLQASINYLTPEIISKGLVIDVSREGLRIESQDPVHIGMRLALVLYLSNDQEPVMIEDATVQWAIGTHFGVKFVKWSTNAEARLNNFFWTGIQEKCESLLHLMTEAAKSSPLNDRIEPQVPTLEDDQRGLIRRTLEECRGVIGGASGAATKLGMKRTSLQYRMKKLGITRTRLDRHP